LPEEQRQSIELAYFGGLTYPEVAEKLGVPLGTVKSRLRLGLQKLQSLLENPNLRADPS
jgi:RNA polymerase sigma-70 factor (ECF subfamily)